MSGWKDKPYETKSARFWRNATIALLVSPFALVLIGILIPDKPLPTATPTQPQPTIPAPSSTPKPQKPSSQRTITTESIGACTKEANDRLTKIAVSGDSLAWENYTKELSAQNCVTLLKVGETVHFEGFASFGTAKLRREGETRIWFTAMEAVSRN